MDFLGNFTQITIEVSFINKFPGYLAWKFTLTIKAQRKL